MASFTCWWIDGLICSMSTDQDADNRSLRVVCDVADEVTVVVEVLELDDDTVDSVESLDGGGVVIF